MDINDIMSRAGISKQTAKGESYDLLGLSSDLFFIS